MRTKILKPYMTIMVVVKLLLLLLLIGFELLPLAPDNDELKIITQINLQLTRNEFLAKDVLILAYRPREFHSQAVSELQTVLPMFQQVQNGLAKGDALLGLPSSPDTVQSVLLSAQPDYTALSTAIKTILASPDTPPDPIQVSIVLQHEGPYVITMYQASTILAQHLEARKIQLLIFRTSIGGVVLLILILNYFVGTRTMFKKIDEQEAEQKQKQDQALEEKQQEAP